MTSPETSIGDNEVFPEGQCRLVLIGKTGCGKSATGNTILGKTAFETKEGFKSVAKNCSMDHVFRFNIEIQVADMPGLEDTDEEDSLMDEIITRSLCAIHPGPHAVLLAVRIDNRFTPEDYKVFLVLKSIFGDDLPRFMIVVFVGADLQSNEETDYEDMLQKASDSLKSILKSVKNRYILFDNKINDENVKRHQAEQLILMTKQLVKENNGGCFEHKLHSSIHDVMQGMIKDELKRFPDWSEGKVLDDNDNLNAAQREIQARRASVQELANKVNVADRVKKFEHVESVPSHAPCPPRPRLARESHVQESPGLQKPSAPQNQGNTLDNAPREQYKQSPYSKSPRPFPFVYEVEDRPGMTFEEKKAMLEKALKHKIANNPEDLSEDQRKAIARSGRGVRKSFKDKMKWHDVKSTEACSVM